MASLLLLALTKSRDPKLLASLRTEAIDSLIEMGRRRSIGHAAAALSILGRISGLDENSLDKLIEAADGCNCQPSEVATGQHFDIGAASVSERDEARYSALWPRSSADFRG